MLVGGLDGVWADLVPGSGLVGEALHEIVCRSGYHRGQHRFFVGVVGVEGGPGEVGSLGYVLDADCVVSLL
jgi:hypothetical protein